MEIYDYKRLAAKLICITFAIAAIYLAFKYGLCIFLPFFVAFCIGVPINKLSVRICRRYGFLRKLLAVFLILLALTLVGLFCYFGVSRLLSETEALMRLVGEDGGGIDQMVDSVTERLSKFAEKLPILRKLGGMEGVSEDIDNGISGLISELVTRLGDSIPAFALEFVKRTPRAVLTIVVTALACFYFAIDYEGIREGLLSLFGGGAERTASRGLRIVSSALKSYAKAYLLIMLITFAEVFVGLLLLKRKYAFIIAIGIAVVDVLPLFGTGAVLIPWALVSFIIGDHGVATGLLVLYGVITIVRQLIEPKIVGANLGIHPLATLFAMFAGLSLFGFFGMLAGPLVIIVIRELFVMGRENADAKKG